MKQTAGKKMRTTSSRDAKYLYVAAFLQAFGIQQWWLALPYIIRHLGGNNSQVGASLAANMAVYALSVLSIGPMLERYNPKRIALTGAAAVTVVVAGMGAIVLLNKFGYVTGGAIWLLLLMTGLFGVVSAGFWAPLMGWLAIGAEGGRLNRRLSRFSLAWSFGALVGPYAAGRLVEIDFIWPLAMATLVLMLCWMVVFRADNPYHFQFQQLHGAQKEVNRGREHQRNKRSQVHPSNLRFRWMGRLALFSATTCVGTVRTQLPLLVTFELGYAESIYGALVTFMTLASLMVYLVVGRTQAWHYRRGFFFAAQLLMAGGMVFILATAMLGWLCLATVLVGIGGAFFYISHLFYGASGGTRRFAHMAVHEFTLSLGFVTGAMLGGVLSDYWGPYAPYRFAGGVVLLAILGEIIIWFALGGINTQDTQDTARRQLPSD